MTLTGNTLAAYNNLPGFPPTPKLGDLLNALNVPNPAYVGLTTPTEIDIFVETTGNDGTGTGTSALPYATLDRALADFINAELPATSIVRIYMGAGDFAKPVLARFVPTNILVMVYGDMSNPVYEGPAEVSSAVATYKALYEVDIGAYADVIGDGTHWMLGHFVEAGVPLYGDFATPCAASTSPNVRYVAYYDTTALARFGIYPYATRLIGDDVLEGNGGLQGASGDPAFGLSGFKLIGIDVYTDPANYTCVIRDVIMSGCRLSAAAFSVLADIYDSVVGLCADSMYVAARGCKITNALFSATSVEMVAGDVYGALFIDESLYPSTDVTCSFVDFRVPGLVAIQPQGCTYVFMYALTVDGASLLDTANSPNCSIIASSVANGRILGTVTGAFAIRLAQGSQGVNLEAACGATLANTTPNADIVVGGNAVVAWAALPTNDSAAGSPQFCRAT